MDNTAFIRIKTALKEKGEYTTITRGVSMYPMFRDGKDMAVIIPAELPLKKNTVALYRRRGVNELVLHRVLKKKGDTYIIRGDNTYSKEYVNERDIVGVLVGFFRNGKYRDCKTDKLYHLYVFFMRLLYPVRCVYIIIKRKLIKKQ